jgi:hypothetical protein
MARLTLLAFTAPLAVLVACSSNTGGSDAAASGSQAEVSDIQSMTRLSDGRFDVLCRDGHHEVVSSDDVVANRVCQTTPSGHGVTLYGSSDSCSSSEVGAIVDDRTNCSTLSASSSCWSVSVNGQCINISDTNLQAACQKYQSAASARLLVFGSSDSCSNSELAAYIGDRTDCSTLSDSDPAWSISIDGRCTNITDTTVRKACVQYRDAATAKVVVYGTSDSCNGDVAAYLRSTTDCSILSSSASAWSVSINGSCVNISDTNVQAACVKYKAAGDAHVVIYGTSDSCASDEVVAYVSDDTDCGALSNDSAWSVSIDGTCNNISDTTVRDACTRFKGAH